MTAFITGFIYGFIIGSVYTRWYIKRITKEFNDAGYVEDINEI